MNHLDLFSGYGGFTIPAQKYGIETINFSEIDKYATAVLKYRFPNIENLGDITKIRGEDLPVIDIITGGSPCQDLSVAGKGAGLDGARSGLFFHFIRLIKEKQPTYFIWENVKGAFSSQRGWDFATVQIKMEQAGYDVWWQLLNAKDFGVQQNRERIFAIGTRKGSGREVLFEQRESEQNLKSVVSGYSQSDRIYDADGVSASISAGENGGGKRPGGFYRVNKIVDTGHDGTNIYGTDGTGVTLKANGGGQGAKTGLYAVPNSNGNIHSLDANYWKGSNNPNKSRRSQIAKLKSEEYQKGVDVALRKYFEEIGDEFFIDKEADKAIPVLTPDRENKRQNGRRFKEDGDPSFTITGQDRHGVFNGMRIRRLTPTECERLMGLEDNWTAKGIMDGEEVDISDTQRYKMCGNGVVVNCVDYIYSLIC